MGDRKKFYPRKPVRILDPIMNLNVRYPIAVKMILCLIPENNEFVVIFPIINPASAPWMMSMF